MKLKAAVIAKPDRQPHRATKKPTSGTPITLENFAAASKIAVDSPRSLRGNQYPVPFELTGKAGASATPSMSLAMYTPEKPPAIAVIVEATPQRNVPIRPTLFTP